MIARAARDPVRTIGTGAAVIAALLVVTTTVRAQDFDAPGPLWPPRSAAALLERGLPDASGSATLEGAIVRWHGLAPLTTRAVAGGSGWRTIRGGLGLSQTGEWDVGWTALGAALGAAERRGGAALRATARRDRTSRFAFDAVGAAVGAEVGGGAWLAATERVHLWASAPQIWKRGAAPPLARALEIGGALDLGGITLWLARSGVAGATRGARGERAAGVSTRAGPLEAWLGARDQPLRGGLGIAARARIVRVAAQVESHPVLGETARLSLALGGGR